MTLHSAHMTLTESSTIRLWPEPFTPLSGKQCYVQQHILLPLPRQRTCLAYRLIIQSFIVKETVHLYFLKEHLRTERKERELTRELTVTLSLAHYRSPFLLGEGVPCSLPPFIETSLGTRPFTSEPFCSMWPSRGCSSLQILFLHGWGGGGCPQGASLAALTLCALLRTSTSPCLLPLRSWSRWDKVSWFIGYQL